MRGLALVLLGLAAASSSAQEPKKDEPAKKPQWQRVLTGEDAKKAANLEVRLDQAITANKSEDAVELATELVALRTRLQGNDHWQAIDARLVLADVKKLPRAVADRDRIAEAVSLSSRAVALFRQGKYQQALPLLESTLDLHRRVYGEEHRRVIGSLGDLSTLYLAQGKQAEATPLCEKAVELARKVFGDSHPLTADGYSNLASSLNGRKSEDAGPLFDKALTIFRNVYGESHSRTATGYYNVGFNLSARGQHAGAAEQYRKAIAIRVKLLGEDDPSTVGCYIGLASALNAQGKVAEAEPLFRKALATHRVVLGENHTTTALSYNNLAVNLRDQGKVVEAGPLFAKGMAVVTAALGDDHPYTAICLNNLASNLQAQGKAAEAEPLFRKAVDLTRRLQGEDHPDTARVYNNLATSLDDQSRLSDALAHYKTALRISEKVNGGDHPFTSTVRNNLAYNLERQGKGEEAGPHHRTALANTSKVQGDSHPQTITCTISLAFNLYVLGRPAEAEPLFRTAAETARRVHGEAHLDTARVNYNLASVLYDLDRRREAVTVLESAIASFEASRQQLARGLDRSQLALPNPRFLTACLLAEEDPTAAWRHLERGLARGLLDQPSARPVRRLSADELAAERTAREQLATLQPAILRLVTRAKRTADEETELQGLLRQQRAHAEQVVRLSAVESERAVETLDHVRAALPADAALVYWVDAVGKSGRLQEHWGCVIRREGDPKWVRLPGTGEKGAWTKEDDLAGSRVQSSLGRNVSAAELDSSLKKLHAQRIAPVAKALVGVKTLYVVGVDYMAGVPVDVLAPEYTISYVPSGTSLARLPKKPAFADTLLAVGDPIYETDKPEAVRLTALPPGGLLIQQVVPGGPADKVKLLPGDVLLKYADTPLKSMDDLRVANQKAVEQKVKEVAVTVWRVDERGKAGERTVNLPAGPLGVVLARDPAPQAIADRRKTDGVLASLRGGGSWKDLPGTRFEVARIAALFERPVVLFDGKASEAEVNTLRKEDRLKGFRYLHFATHGKGNDVLAFDSALILSQDQPGEEFAPADRPWRDNRVTAREVLDHWKLNADLVTLSACETAIGKQGGGDGLLGFAQAFLTAGSRSVCLSLWEVDDTATALLMHRFYQNLLGKREGLKSPLPKAAALREAKEWLRNLSADDALKAGAALTNGVVRGGRKEITGKVVGTPPKPTQPGAKPYAHPQYWAAFVLLGDPD